MSEFESDLPVPDPDPEQMPRPSRLRRFLLRHVPLALAGLMALVSMATVGLYLWMSSAQFEGVVRKRLIAELEKSTGGRVEIGSFHWRLLHLEADADDLVIHGSEGPGDAPYARVDRLSTRVSLLGFWSPSVRLRDLDIFHPAIHLIVYPDGTTNQPRPRTPSNIRNAQPRYFLRPSGRPLVCRTGISSTMTTALPPSTSRTAGSPLTFRPTMFPCSCAIRPLLPHSGDLSHRSRRCRLNLSRGASSPLPQTRCMATSRPPSTSPAPQHIFVRCASPLQAAKAAAMRSRSPDRCRIFRAPAGRPKSWATSI